MDFGVAFASSLESWRAVKRAEALGFEHAWFYDTQLLNPDAGWQLFTGSVGPAVGALADMQKTWREAGRTEKLYATCYSKRAIAQAGPMAAVFFHDLVE